MVYVALISYTPDPERTIAAAARVSASPAGASQLMQKLTPQAVDRLLTRLISSGHLSVFEHASFTFAIEGISRVTSHQLVR
ncbi:MAG: FAD-dependent thymidylate synthase, partial [Dehalococcoidia bacterium]|nr:FAD-dependent thymidylate synthase [Dehalococcoidia bacterium]